MTVQHYGSQTVQLWVSYNFRVCLDILFMLYLRNHKVLWKCWFRKCWRIFCCLVRDNAGSLFEGVLTQDLLMLSFTCLVTGKWGYLAYICPDCTPGAQADFFSLETYVMSTGLSDFLIFENHLVLSFRSQLMLYKCINWRGENRQRFTCPTQYTHYSFCTLLKYCKRGWTNRLVSSHHISA